MLAFLFSLFKNDIVGVLNNSVSGINKPIDIIDSQIHEQEKILIHSSEEFRNYFLKEKMLVAQIDKDPKKTELRLQNLAQQIKEEEAQWLTATALNQELEGDERFLGAYLLAQAKSPISFPALRKIALSPVPKTNEPRNHDLEIQIRSIALEGLSKFCGDVLAKSTLDEAGKIQNDEFLRDRANRSAYAWQHCIAVEQQDQNALEEVLYGK